MDLTDELRARHVNLSSTQLEFLEFLAAHPRGFERSYYAPVHVTDEYTPFPVQSWPLFLGAELRSQFERAACSVSRLIRSVPQRFLGGNAERLRTFYGLSQEQAVLISTLIRTTGILDGAFARCDFLNTPGGLKCVEMNAGNVSGWQTAKYLDRFLRVPAIRSFLAERPGEVTFRSPIRALFSHFIEEGRDLADDGVLNLCFAVNASAELGQWVSYLSQEYSATLAATGKGLQGSLIACEVGELEAGQGVLRAGNRRVHIVHEPSFGRLTRPLLAALLAGKVRLYNGPTSRVLADKGNLAILSESVDSALLNAEERAAVEAWIPWTRRIVSGTTTFEGEEVHLPEWLLAERERVVLKARFSLGGKEVHVGRFTPPEEWAALVQTALEEERWVAQEFMEVPPYLFLSDAGCVPHDLVWGLFTFGNRFGGSFFRVQEQSRASRGVVNATQGASFGLVLEVRGEGEDRQIDGESGVHRRIEQFLNAGPVDAAGEDQPMGRGASPLRTLTDQDLALRARGYLSHAHESFAQFVAQQPEDALRRSYEALYTSNRSTLSKLEPWPVFVSKSRAQMLATVATDLARILLQVPRRVFDNDPARFEEYYQLGEDAAQMIASVIDLTDILSSATARGDFLETADGIKCLEWNVTGGLGGWSAGVWTRGALGDPMIHDFLAQSGLETTFEDPLQAVLRRILAESGSLAEGGTFDIAFAMPTEAAMRTTGGWPEDYARAYEEVRKAHGQFEGSAVTCLMQDFERQGRALRLGERRIHAVVEACGGHVSPPVLSALMAGTARVYNGPASRVLGNKLNLALLSETADSDLWSAAERRIIRAHVPWTRRLSTHFVDFEGERVYLPDLLLDQQERMVVKSGYSAHGDEVFVGAGMSSEQWEEIVERGLGDRGWVAQEFVEGITYLFQANDDPSRAPCPHDLVWGLLTFGEQYGGNFVRLMARGNERVINAARGACVGAVLEVDEDATGSPV